MKSPARHSLAALLLAVTLAVAPAVGVPHEDMLQDTLKSILISLGGLMALLLLFVERRGDDGLAWHWTLVLPLALAVHAASGLLWSHAWLAGVEAVRWTMLAAIAFVALNVVAPRRSAASVDDEGRHAGLVVLGWGVHAGAIAAAAWAVAQFLWDIRVFPQGPNPGSTFLNRNFFAEYAACTLPFGAWLVARAGSARAAVPLAASVGLVVVAICMTGTRSALIASALLLAVVFPLGAWACRKELNLLQAAGKVQVAAGAAFLGTVLALGSVQTGNPVVVAEHRGLTGLERAVTRSAAIRMDDESLGLRFVMWRATVRAIEDRPLSGIGAGAWEAYIPLYQTEVMSSEQEYYAHNGFLQVLAEYGLVGWFFVLGLVGYLVRSAWRGLRWRESSADRLVLLSSVLALLVVSCLGFPWRLAVTGAVLAVCLGALAGLDLRRTARQPAPAARSWQGILALSPEGRLVGGLVASVSLALAVHISMQAQRAEANIIGAARLSLQIVATGQPDHPSLAPLRRQVLTMAEEGIGIHPHYRKITPIIAENLARAGDVANALEVWQSVLKSRPYVVGILVDAARAHAVLGAPEPAERMLALALRLRPTDKRALLLRAELTPPPLPDVAAAPASPGHAVDPKASQKEAH